MRFNSLIDVVQSDAKVFLIFEFLDRDLKRYIDLTASSPVSIKLVKVQTVPNFPFH